MKTALRTVVPTAYRRYAVKDCHPAISALKIQPHRLCTLQQWKRGILNLAGFDAWQRFQERPLCSICNTNQHSRDVQGTLTWCQGEWPKQWRLKFFKLFPASWTVQDWFAQASEDAQRRFIRTLPATPLVQWLRVRKGVKIPEINKAWGLMHKKWLAFWVESKSMMSPTPRPPAPQPPTGAPAAAPPTATARLVAQRRATARQTRFRHALMLIPEISTKRQVTQLTMTQYVTTNAPASHPAHHQHQVH